MIKSLIDNDYMAPYIMDYKTWLVTAFLLAIGDVDAGVGRSNRRSNIVGIVDVHGEFHLEDRVRANACREHVCINWCTNVHKDRVRLARCEMSLGPWRHANTQA